MRVSSLRGNDVMMLLFNYCKSMDTVHINCRGLVRRLIRMMRIRHYESARVRDLLERCSCCLLAVSATSSALVEERLVTVG